MRLVRLTIGIMIMLVFTAQAFGAYPSWVREGLLVTYFFVSGEVSQAPWSGQSSGASSVHGYDTYVIKQVSPNRVSYREVLYMPSQDTGIFKAIDDNLQSVPVNNLFHGPFWIDPVVLGNVRVGSTVALGTPLKIWHVSYVGRIDLSPESSDLKNLVGFELLIPYPSGYYRNVVVLYTEENGQRFNMAVDRDSGLIYFITMSQLSGGTWNGSSMKPLRSQITVKALAEVSYGVDTTKPRFWHAGYYISAWALSSWGGFANWVFEIVGAYQNRAEALELIAFTSPSTYNLPNEEVDFWKLEYVAGSDGNGDIHAEVAGRQVIAGAVSVRNLGDSYRFFEVLNREYAQAGEAVKAFSNGDAISYRIFVKHNLKPSGIDFSRLYVSEDGSLLGVGLSLDGMDLSDQTGTMGTLDIVNDILSEVGAAAEAGSSHSSGVQDPPTERIVQLVVDPQNAPVRVSGGALSVDFAYSSSVDILVGVATCDFRSIYWLHPESCSLSTRFGFMSRSAELHCDAVPLPSGLSSGYVFWLVSPKSLSLLDFKRDPYLLMFYMFGVCR